jgi:hypothetical protein
VAVDEVRELLGIASCGNELVAGCQNGLRQRAA